MPTLTWYPVGDLWSDQGRRTAPSGTVRRDAHRRGADPAPARDQCGFFGFARANPYNEANPAVGAAIHPECTNLCGRQPLFMPKTGKKTGLSQNS